jgi:hypothetical protein
VASFYAQTLTTEEQRLLAGAPVTSELKDEIALVRARIAALSASGPTTNAELLIKLLDVLARLVAAQSRASGIDHSLAELNFFRFSTSRATLTIRLPRPITIIPNDSMVFMG